MLASALLSLGYFVPTHTEKLGTTVNVSLLRDRAEEKEAAAAS